MRRFLYLAALAVIIVSGVLITAACGARSIPVPQTTAPLTTPATPPATSPATPPVTTSATPPATTPATPPATAPATSKPGASAAVVIENFAYSPAALKVAAGTTVTWTNKDSVGHTVTTRSPLFDSGPLGKERSFSYTFNQKGEYEYYCIPHPYMVGKVTVD